MKKTFTHNGITFKIVIRLNYLVERKLDGLRQHLVSLYKSDNILLESVIQHDELFDCIAKFTKHAEDLADDKVYEKNKTENRLIELGFEEI